MNVSHLSDSDLIARLENMWATEERQATIDERTTESLFFKGLYKSKRITKTWGKHQRDHRRREEQALRLKFEEAQLQLQSDPQNHMYQEVLSNTHLQLLEYDMKQAK